MSEKEKPFDELLSELIQMYRRLRNSNKEMNIEIDGDFDFLLKQYQNIKSNVDNDLFNEMGMPLKEMLESLLNELRKELDEDVSNLEIKEFDEDVMQVAISKIDEKLKQENLSTNEINELLDKRSKLLAQVKTS